jgi:hypothetical protein
MSQHRSTVNVPCRINFRDIGPASLIGLDTSAFRFNTYAFEAQRDRAFLFRELATLRTDIPLFASVEELRPKRHRV